MQEPFSFSNAKILAGDAMTGEVARTHHAGFGGKA